jgi:hypothetical protein
LFGHGALLPQAISSGSLGEPERKKENMDEATKKKIDDTVRAVAEISPSSLKDGDAITVDGIRYHVETASRAHGTVELSYTEYVYVKLGEPADD